MIPTYRAFGEAIFPARLTARARTPEGIWLYSWVEMEVGVKGELREALSGRKGIPRDGAAVDLNNAFVDVPSDGRGPVVWLRLRGGVDGRGLRYEFAHNDSARIVYCRTGKYPPGGYWPGYHIGFTMTWDAETEEWIPGGTVAIKPANRLDVIQVEWSHIAVPAGCTVAGQGGLSTSLPVWIATGNSSACVAFDYGLSRAPYEVLGIDGVIREELLYSGRVIRSDLALAPNEVCLIRNRTPYVGPLRHSTSVLDALVGQASGTTVLGVPIYEVSVPSIRVSAANTSDGFGGGNWLATNHLHFSMPSYPTPVVQTATTYGGSGVVVTTSWAGGGSGTVRVDEGWMSFYNGVFERIDPV